MSQPTLSAKGQGILPVAIVADSQAGCVRLEFGKPITSLAFGPEAAVDFAELMVEAAGQVVMQDSKFRLPPPAAVPHSKS